MITKAQAIALRQTFIAALPDRIDAAITSAVAQGLTTVTVSYAPANTAVANALLAQATAAGWATSSVNTVAQTITIAP